VFSVSTGESYSIYSALVQRLTNIDYTIVNTIMPGKIAKTAGQ
jgi:hypothetical protein